MREPMDETFLKLLNENIGIAHKVGRVYFPNEDDREDALQEMMFHLWRSYPRFKGLSKFSTWMYSVCLNTALTYKRKITTKRVEPISINHYQIAGEPPSTREASINELYNAIAMLTPLNKAIVLLYLEDMRYDEIADITGLSKANVSVRLVRIKKELERLLITKEINDKKDDDPGRIQE